MDKIVVNHFYTLLRNEQGRGFSTGDGEEYTPPGYRPVALPGALASVRAALYGDRPDRRTITYRTRQLVALVHASELDPFTRMVDPRITYLPLDGDSFELAPDAVVAAAVGNDHPLYVLGDVPEGLIGGRAEATWTVTVAGSPSAAGPWPLYGLNLGDESVPGGMVVAGDDGRLPVTTAIAFSGGLSTGVPLGGTGLTLCVRDDAPDGATWRVAVRGRPDGDLGAVLSRVESAGAAALAALFGTSRFEPWQTWRNLWEARLRPLPLRLGAAALALAARTDELRNVGG